MQNICYKKYKKNLLKKKPHILLDFFVVIINFQHVHREYHTKSASINLVDIFCIMKKKIQSCLFSIQITCVKFRL